jgi:hypothetical protein
MGEEIMAPKTYRNLVLLNGLAVSLLVAGCGTTTTSDGGSTATASKLGPEQRMVNRFQLALEPQERGIVGTDLGLALSGGGIRSAMFNLGVVKSLYDAGVLDRVDIISSVSGGGYIAYWLYANHHLPTGDKSRFARSALEQSTFGARWCELLTASNFVTYGDMIRTTLSRTPYHQMYEREIVYTFANNENPPRTLTQLAKAPHGAARAPYWIINATIVDPVPIDGWSDGRLELTPILKGNESAGYSEWTAGQDIPVRKAVAISGAAFRAALKQTIDNPLPAIKKQQIVVDDGGHSENLGAVALIRRGVKNVIVSDAEMDPNYEFDAYLNLKTRLRHWGLRLAVPAIDEFLAQAPLGKRRPPLWSSVQAGVVTDIKTGATISSIYYIKMARTASITSLIAENGAGIDAGREVNTRYYDQLKATAASPSRDGGQSRWNCSKAIDVSHTDMKNWFQFEMDNYIRVADNNWKLKVVNRFGSRTPYGEDLHVGFPQYTTFDQSFNLSQTMAYVGLGYFETDELRAIAPQLGRR